MLDPIGSSDSSDQVSDRDRNRMWQHSRCEIQIESSTEPGAQAAATIPWYRELNRYQWLVLIIASLGWMFDTMDQQLFNLARRPAIVDLLKVVPGDPVAAARVKDALARPLLEFVNRAQQGRFVISYAIPVNCQVMRCQIDSQGIGKT